MQIIISIMIVGILWMIYDLINAPKVDEDENFVDLVSDEEINKEEAPAEENEIEPRKKVSKIK